MAVATRSTFAHQFAGAQTAPLYPWPAGMPAPTRREAEEMVEGLIAYLDSLDGDADLEPSLGSLDATSHGDFMGQEAWNLGGGQDREAGDDNGLGDEDGMIWATQVMRRAA